MDWQARYFPTEIFPSIGNYVDGMIAEERWFAPEIVGGRAECRRDCGTDRLGESTTADVRASGRCARRGLSIQARFPGLKDPKAEYEEADAYVIALAKLRDGIVVTQETSAAEKNKPKRTHFIPDVCRELGLPCISLLG